jgi:hypothetical protein
MKVFISHSMIDKNLVSALDSVARSLRIQPLIAEHSVSMTSITEKVEKMILESDLVIVVLTRDGFNSNFVQQEIGYAKGKKPLLLLVERGYEKSVSGFVYGHDFISVDPWNLQPAVPMIQRILASQKQKVEKQEAIGQLILAGAGILFFAALVSGSK